MHTIAAIRFLAVFAFSFLSLSAATTSELWGMAGERWTPAGRLPDVSYAGYRFGEQPIPTPAVTANVRDFGAKGDGTTDDTAAFQRAIMATKAGAILVPDGRYLITDFITIDKPDLVLRGASRDGTVLWFPKPLTDVKPNWGATTTGKRTSNYSWGGGYLVLEGSDVGPVMTTITATAKRGDTWLTVADTGRLTVGEWVEVGVRDDQTKSLTAWLYQDEPGSLDALNPQPAHQLVRIEEVDAANRRFRCNRPLRFETRAAWSPQVRACTPTVTGSGFEHLTCEFPTTPWSGEFTELGYNAVALRPGVQHCWVRDLHLINAEGGLFSHASHCTISDIVLTATKSPYTKWRYNTPQGCTGHHGISIYGGDHVITRFDFRMAYVHDLSVESALSAGNVFSQGRGDDLCFDHHKGGPYGNVFTNLDCGAGNRIWRCGGGAKLGQQTAGWATFWNLRAAKSLSAPPKGWGPWTMNLVGLTTNDPSRVDPNGLWFEPIPSTDLIPQDLHAAQLARRLKR